MSIGIGIGVGVGRRRPGTPGTSRYRWVVLAAGVFAQAGFVAVPLGLPSIAVPMRDALSLSATELGLVLAASAIGMIMTSYLWGRLSDRVGESRVVMIGLFGAGGAMFGASLVDTAAPLIALLLLAGAFGSSANAASGKAVMNWFPDEGRGLAMGIRQTAQPLAGAAGAALLPVVVLGHGVSAGLAALAALCVVAAGLAGPILSRPYPAVEQGTAPEPVQVPEHGPGRGWVVTTRIPTRAISLPTICVISGLLVIPQFTLASFAPLYLHDSRAMSVPAAAAVVALAQAISVVARIMVGIWSDRIRDRTLPLLACAGALSVLLPVTALASGTSLAAQVTLIVVTTVIAMTWNPLAFLIAGESALPARQGAALGMQNTIVLGFGALTRVAIAPLMDGVGWLPLLAVELLLPAAVALLVLCSPARHPIAEPATRRSFEPREPAGRFVGAQSSKDQ